MKKSILLMTVFAMATILFASWTTPTNSTNDLCDSEQISATISLEMAAAPQCYTEEDLEAFMDCFGQQTSECKVWDLNSDGMISTADLLILLARYCG